jgi:hypothetical protein
MRQSLLAHLSEMCRRTKLGHFYLFFSIWKQYMYMYIALCDWRRMVLGLQSISPHA